MVTIQLAVARATEMKTEEQVGEEIAKFILRKMN